MNSLKIILDTGAFIFKLVLCGKSICILQSKVTQSPHRTINYYNSDVRDFDRMRKTKERGIK